MRLKVNILLILICFVFNKNLFAQIKDSFLYLKIADVNTYNNINNQSFKEMDFAFFDIDKNVLYFSFEINNKKTNFINAEIKKTSNLQNKLKPILQKKININNNHFYIDSIDITDKLISGNYDLIISAMTDSNEKIANIKIGFQTIRNYKGVLKNEFEEIILPEDIDLSKTFVAKYTNEQLLKNIKALKPIGELAELRAIETFEVDSKNAKRFFYNFWYNRNSSDPEKEWKAYADNLNYVANNFGNGGMAGYETDRGKLYLMFGEPHTIEKRDNEKGALPYEIWFYYETKGRKNVKFLFYQPGSISGQMKLLNSTEQDILVNPYWKNVMLADPTNGDNKLMYRVFEYFK